MYKYFFTFFFFSQFAFAQIDRQNSFLNIPIKEALPERTSVGKNYFLNYSQNVHGLSTVSKAYGFQVQHKERNLLTTVDREAALKQTQFKRNSSNTPPKHFKKLVDGGPIFQRDQYLGDYTTKSNYVELWCRDHGAIDGDKVAILIEDVVVHKEILLIGSFKRIKLDLKKGFNRIEIMALNHGLTAPNTAEFRLIDSEGTVISDKQWNLSTGFKATMIFIKE